MFADMLAANYTNHCIVSENIQRPRERQKGLEIRGQGEELERPTTFK